MAKKPIRKHAAIITIFDAGMMTPVGRTDVAKWLRNHADDLEKEGMNYSSTFRGRFQYRK